MGAKVFVSVIFSDHPVPNDREHPDVVAWEIELPDAESHVDYARYLAVRDHVLLFLEDLPKEYTVTPHEANMNSFSKGIFTNVLDDLTPNDPLAVGNAREDGSGLVDQ